MRDGLKIKQAEWNIVKIGNSAHTGKCIRARYKNIRMETIDNNSPRTISIMSNGVIDVSCSGLSYTKSTDNPYIIYIYKLIINIYKLYANHGELIPKIFRNISFPGRDTDLIPGKLIHFSEFLISWEQTRPRPSFPEIGLAHTPSWNKTE